MDDLEVARNQKRLEEMIERIRKEENTDVTKLSDDELVNLINSTADVTLLDKAEQEYVDRMVRPLPQEEIDSYVDMNFFPDWEKK